MIALSWYLLKVIICSGILCGYYFLALRNKAFHGWNRFYILAAIIISLLAPIIKINIFQNDENKGTVVQLLQTISYGDNAVIEYSRNNGFQLNTQNVAESAYLLISAIFLFIFFVSLYKILRLKKKYPETEIENISFINTNAKGTPFSFFKCIFWNQAIDLHSKSGQQIFNHEIAHVKEKHSYDKIFMNVVLIFFWINPFFWLMRKELNMIHEFVADKEAMEDSDINAFAEMILQTVYPGQKFSFTNNFFYSPIKRRIMMLATNKNPKVSYISRLLVLPLAAILFFAFTLKVKTVNDAAFKSTLHNVSRSTSVLKIMYDTFPKSKKTTQVNVISINGLNKTNKKEDTKVVVMNEDDSIPPPLIMGIEEQGSIPPNALLIANGKEISNKEMKNISPHNILSINILKGKSAIKKYGEKGKDGVIEITTIYENIYSTKNDSSNSPGIPPGTLIFVDGKEIARDKIKNIPVVDIQSISILKGESAIKKYRNKAKDGVIEITTKDKSGKLTSISKYGKTVYCNTCSEKNDSVPDKVFTKVENEASFPGGPPAWQKYIASRIQASLDSFIEADYGTCLIKFIVNTDGTVSNVEATTMKGTHLANISMEAIKNGPKWIPASQNGKAVVAYRLQPVTLTNPDQKKSSAETKQRVNFTPLTIVKVDKNILLKLQQPASFPGGQSAWLKYISRIIQKNGNELIANENNQGICKVRFIVNKDGRVSDVQAINKQGTQLADVAVNAIKQGPRWNPGTLDGNRINSYVIQPIGFSLSDKLQVREPE